MTIDIVYNCSDLQHLNFTHLNCSMSFYRNVVPAQIPINDHHLIQSSLLHFSTLWKTNVTRNTSCAEQGKAKSSRKKETSVSTQHVQNTTHPASHRLLHQIKMNIYSELLVLPFYQSTSFSSVDVQKLFTGIFVVLLKY